MTAELPNTQRIDWKTIAIRLQVGTMAQVHSLLSTASGLTPMLLS